MRLCSQWFFRAKCWSVMYAYFRYILMALFLLGYHYPIGITSITGIYHCLNTMNAQVQHKHKTIHSYSNINWFYWWDTFLDFTMALRKYNYCSDEVEMQFSLKGRLTTWHSQHLFPGDGRPADSLSVSHANEMPISVYIISGVLESPNMSQLKDVASTSWLPPAGQTP